MRTAIAIDEYLLDLFQRLSDRLFAKCGKNSFWFARALLILMAAICPIKIMLDSPWKSGTVEIGMFAAYVLGQSFLLYLYAYSYLEEKKRLMGCVGQPEFRNELKDRDYMAAIRLLSPISLAWFAWGFAALVFSRTRSLDPITFEDSRIHMLHVQIAYLYVMDSIVSVLFAFFVSSTPRVSTHHRRRRGGRGRKRSY